MSRGAFCSLGTTHIEAISAIDEFTKRKPTQQIKNIQIKPAVPPLISPTVATL